MSGQIFRSGSRVEDDFYKWIAPIYDPLVGPFLRPVRNAVLRSVRACGCRRVLDIGCGTGEQARLLAKHGFVVAGLDLSPAMLSTARGSGQREIDYFLGSGEDLPFSSGSFDCVVISLALHEMEYPTAGRVTHEALRVLAPEGKLIVFDYLRARDFVAGSSLALLHIVERIAGKRHFGNFKYFVGLGGLDAFVENFPLIVTSRSGYFGGAIGLIVSKKPS